MQTETSELDHFANSRHNQLRGNEITADWSRASSLWLSRLPVLCRGAQVSAGVDAGARIATRARGHGLAGGDWNLGQYQCKLMISNKRTRTFRSSAHLKGTRAVTSQ